MFQLKDQVAIVTGGARGIGAGICDIFCRAGATVIMWDILDGEPTAALMRKKGHKVTFCKVDITDENVVGEAVAAVIKEHRKVDILINNAGIIRDRSFKKMSRQEWDQVISINLDGLFVVTKAVVPHMVEAGYGRIVSASSINAMTGAFGQANYAATKAATQGFTRSLCQEYGKYGITVNCVAPGFIKSAMSDSMPAEVIEAGIAKIPVGRIGTPEDMGYVYLFLASKEAGFVNGVTMHANGGAYPI
jgi:3-oxoacyl-[acyl-carrier protein] reductase